MDTNELRVLIVKASSAAAAAIGWKLAKHPQVSSVAHSDQSSRIIQFIRNGQADLVMLDDSFAGQVQDLPVKVKASFPHVRLVALTEKSDHAYLGRLQKEGYDAILFEPALAHAFPVLVSHLAAEEFFLSPELSPAQDDTPSAGQPDAGDNAMRSWAVSYFDLYHKAPEMHLSIRPEDATVLECNNTMLEKTGYAKNEVIGKPVFEFYHPDHMEEALQAFSLFSKTGHVENRKLWIRTKQGRKIPVLLNVMAVRDNEGHLLYSNSTWLDLSEPEAAGSNRDGETIRGKARLTRREYEVFSLLGQGLNDKQIAVNLALSLRTVRQHHKNLKQKLAIAGLLDHLSN